MAKWITFRKRDGNFKFIFVNIFTDEVATLSADLRADTPDDMVIDWVIQVGQASIGDIIVLDSGKVVQIVKPGLA